MAVRLRFISTVILIVTLAWASLAAAQSTTTGEIYGGVIDKDSAQPLPDASMMLENLRNGRPLYGRTNGRGSYVFSLVPPGAYRLRAERKDYLALEYPGIEVPLNQPKLVIPVFALSKIGTRPNAFSPLRSPTTALSLVPPAQNPPAGTTPSGAGLTSLVSLRDWALRWNFDSSVLEAVPLRRGRTFDQLALFAPGVARAPYSSGQGPAVGIGVGSIGQFSVNGLRSRSNNFTVDGSDNNDEDIGMRRQGFVALVPQSVESIQEFQVMTAGFPADFGRNTGSIVNAISKSGETAVHGTVYGLFNNDALNARNPFDTTFMDSINSGSLNGGSYSGKDVTHSQYGGTVGGPIVQKRLFYFASAERQQHHGTALHHFVVPADNERGLRITNFPLSGLQQFNGFVPSDRLQEVFNRFAFVQTPDGFQPYSSEAGTGMFSLYPRPNNPAGPFREHNYSQVAPYDAGSKVFSTKLDWYPSIHSLQARYNSTNDDSRIPFTGDAINSAIGTRTRTRNFSLVLNTATSFWANALRVSYGRTDLAFPPEKGSRLLFGSSASLASPEFRREIQTRYGNFGPFGSSGPIGQLAILPFSRVGIDVYNFPQGRVDNTYQLSDFVTRVANRHIVKAGFDIRYSQLNSFADRNSRPLIVFGYGEVGEECQSNPFCPFATADGMLHGTDLASFGAPSGVLQALSTDPAADTTIGLRLTQYDFFLQDDWAVTKNLTLNVGLRYEYMTVPHETNNRIEKTFGISADQFGHLPETGPYQAVIKAGNQAFDQAVQGLQQFLAGRQRIYDADGNNFAPRVGFAWDPKGRGKTAIHAGYSIHFDANPGAYTSQSRNVFPTFAPVNVDLNFNSPTGQFINNPIFFKFDPTQTQLIRPGTLNVYNLAGDAFATGLGTLFNQQPFNPALDFSTNGLAFTLPEKKLRTAYAQHYLVSGEQQFGDNWLASVAYVGTRGEDLARVRTPNGGLISKPVLLYNTFNEILFNALTNKRPTSSLGAYEVMDNAAASTYHSMQVAVLKRLSRGLQLRSSWTWSHAIDEVSDMFDTRAFFALPEDNAKPERDRASANFDVRHRVTGFLTWNGFRNWEFALTGEFQTGQPYTINTVVDNNGDGNLTDRPGIGRNTARAAGIATVDAAVGRRLRFGSNWNILLRAEAFNLFNHANPGVPVRILESPGFGTSFDTQVDPRSLRLVAKVSF